MAGVVRQAGMNDRTHALRSIDAFQCSNAALLVALCENVSTVPPSQHHEALVFLAWSIATDEVLEALRNGAAVARGEASEWEPAWARRAGEEMAEAVLRAVAVVLVDVGRYKHHRALEFAVLDPFTARFDELEGLLDAFALAPVAAWENLRCAGLAPELGGAWWADGYVRATVARN